MDLQALSFFFLMFSQSTCTCVFLFSGMRRGMLTSIRPLVPHQSARPCPTLSCNREVSSSRRPLRWKRFLLHGWMCPSSSSVSSCCLEEASWLVLLPTLRLPSSTAWLVAPVALARPPRSHDKAAKNSQASIRLPLACPLPVTATSRQCLAVEAGLPVLAPSPRRLLFVSLLPPFNLPFRGLSPPLTTTATLSFQPRAQSPSVN